MGRISPAVLALDHQIEELRGKRDRLQSEANAMNSSIKVLKEARDTVAKAVRKRKSKQEPSPTPPKEVGL